MDAYSHNPWVSIATYSAKNVERQVAVTSLTTTTSTSSTLLPADAPSSTTVTTPSVIPIIISIMSTAVSTSNSAASSATPSAGLSSDSISPQHSSTLSSSAAIIASTAPAESRPSNFHFSPIDLVPAFGVVALFILGLGIWLLYGCCTRRPRVSKEGSGLISGPAYADICAEGHDVEQRGQADDMVSFHQFSQNHNDARYQWPSYNERPAFDHDTGFYVPAEYMHDHDHKTDEDNPLLSASLVAPGRRRYTRTLHNSKMSASATQVLSPSLANTSHVHGFVSRQHSSATSAALRDLYESDSEEDAKRRAQEAPWESLRHKSIKRGILEQVKKENTWMDSVRSSLMGVNVSSAAIQVPGPKRRGNGNGNGAYASMREEPLEERVSSPQVAQHKAGRRRGHVRADSDIQIPNNCAEARDDVSEYSRRADEHAQEQRHLHHTPPGADYFTREVNESISQSPKHARGRRTFAWLKDVEREDRYTPLPERLNQSRSPSRSERRSHSRNSNRSRSKSKSRSSSPVKLALPRPQAAIARSVGVDGTRAPTFEERVDRGRYDVSAAHPLEILPQSPPQIMSPPLESQMFFTSTAPLSLSPKPSASPKKRAGKSRRSQSIQNPMELSPGLSFHMTGTPVSASSSATKGPAGVGRRRPKMSPKSRLGRTPSSPDEEPSRPTRRDTQGDEGGTLTMMQKVDHIMEAGWNERDLGSVAIRTLSPTGFGRHV